MDNVKYFEEYIIKNESELGISGNWSADYHVHVAKGRKPYKKVGYKLIEVEIKSRKSLPLTGIVFLNPKSAEKLNEIGDLIRQKIELYNQLFDSEIYQSHNLAYKTEPELKGRRSGVKEKS